MLRNETGSTDIVRTSVLDKLGAELQTLSKERGVELNALVAELLQKGLAD